MALSNNFLDQLGFVMPGSSRCQAVRDLRLRQRQLSDAGVVMPRITGTAETNGRLSTLAVATRLTKEPVKNSLETTELCEAFVLHLYWIVISFWHEQLPRSSWILCRLFLARLEICKASRILCGQDRVTSFFFLHVALPYLSPGTIGRMGFQMQQLLNVTLDNNSRTWPLDRHISVPFRTSHWD